MSDKIGSMTKLKRIGGYIGTLFVVMGVVLLAPIIVGLGAGELRNGGGLLAAFLSTALIALVLGVALVRFFPLKAITVAEAMLVCALGWITASAIGALPYCIALKISFLDAYFETVSGFTTTGTTILSGLDSMPRSVLFWRSLTQWLGGLGILTFFLAVTFRGGTAAARLFSAESHKISAPRPLPGIFSTLKILWAIYSALTVAAFLTFLLLGMGLFDAANHAMTLICTGGFSPHDASIGFYAGQGLPTAAAIEYAASLFMVIGAINFFVHYRVLSGQVRALWDNVEVRVYYWILFCSFLIIVVSAFLQTGVAVEPAADTVRHSVFQTTSIISSTGYGTRALYSNVYGSAARQTFMFLMLIGGCVGSTAGGFKVLRVAILGKLVQRDLFRLSTPRLVAAPLVVDGRIVDTEEVLRIAGLFFAWAGFLVLGGLVTALFSDFNGWQAFSGMFSALGNTGPSLIPQEALPTLHPAVKLSYIVGMLTGRLEILPMLMIFTRRAWR